MDLAPVTLGRATLQISGRIPNEFAYRGGLGASHLTLSRLFVKLPGNGCRTALHGQASHRHLPLQFSDMDNKAVTHANLFSGLSAIAIDLDPPTLDGLRGQTTRLVKPRCPQPFVDPHPFNLHAAMVASKP